MAVVTVLATPIPIAVAMAVSMTVATGIGFVYGWVCSIVGRGGCSIGGGRLESC